MVSNLYKEKVSAIIAKAKERGAIKSYSEFCKTNKGKEATITEQNNNQSNNIRIKYNESEYTLSELSKIYNIKRATLYDRIKRGGTIDEALNRKVAKRNRVKSVSFNV